MRRREGAPPRVTIRACARALGIAEATIRKAVLDGRVSPPDKDGRVDPNQVARELEANSDPRFQRNGRDGRSDPETAGVRKRILTAAAGRAELELGRLQGSMVDARDVAIRWENISRRARQRLEAIPDRLAAALAAEGDPAEVHRLLRAEIRVACAELAGGGPPA